MSVYSYWLSRPPITEERQRSSFQGLGPFPSSPVWCGLGRAQHRGKKILHLSASLFPTTSEKRKEEQQTSPFFFYGKRKGNRTRTHLDCPGPARPRPLRGGRGRCRDYRALSRFWRESHRGREGGRLLLLLPGFLVATTTVAMAPSVFPHRGNCCYPLRCEEGGMGGAWSRLDGG